MVGPDNSSALTSATAAPSDARGRRSIIRLAWWTKLALAIWCAELLVRIFLILGARRDLLLFLDAKILISQVSFQNGRTTIALGPISNMVLLAVVVLFFCWVYRAAANSRALGAHTTISPGWAVGWYFIPIANLWKPYEAMREIWKTSSSPLAWQSQPTPALLSWWWSFHLMSLLVSISFNPGGVGALAWADGFDLAKSGIRAIAALLCYLLVSRVTEKQVAAYRSGVSPF
jgi:hypothetical protein